MMSQSSQSQPLLSPEELSDTGETSPSPPLLPKEPRRLRSQTATLASTTTSASPGGPSTRSSSRGRGTLPPPPRLDSSATPITPSRTATGTTHARPPASRVSATTSPNSYAILGEEDRSPDTENADIPPGNPTSSSTDVAHGWDLFVHGLDDTTKGEMGVIDPILINYANFVGDELRAFHRESAHLLTRLNKLDDDMSFDHDAVVKVDQSLEFLKTLVTANAMSIQQTDINIKGLTTALGEVKEMSEKALRLASEALPTLTSHCVKLDRLEEDVSRLHAEFDGLQSPPDHTPQIVLLEADVSRIDAAVEELRTQIKTATSATDASTVTRDNTGMQRTTPDDTAALPSATAPLGDTEFDTTATLPSANTQGPTRMSGFRSPLFPNADPYYSQPRETAASRRVPQGDYPRMNADRSPFRENGRPVAGRSSFHDGNPHHDRHPPPDDHIRLHEEDDDSLGGMIVSPRNADRRRQALAARISPLDVARLGNVRYHGGVKGYSPLTMAIVHRCGYTALNSTDVILNYNDIIRIHSTIWETWEHPRGNYKGPQLDKILEKGLASFPRLSTVDVEASVDFYDSFQKTALLYLLPVVPFDCISIKMGFEALCPPGLGLHKYAAIAAVMMELLPRLLPRSDTQVSSLVNMVRAESGNGYDLLWRVLALSVPGFDPSIQVSIPVWRDDDIFDFALSFLLYFRLQAKKGVVQDDRTHSLTFLNALGEPAYADSVTTLLTCITNYPSESEWDDGYLPTHLCVMGLANQIHTHARSRALAVVPKIRRTIAMGDEWDRRATIQGSPRIARLDARDNGRPHLQDFGRGSPRVNTRDDSRPGGYRPLVQGGRDGGRTRSTPTPRGRYARPDRNGGDLNPSVVCDACRRTGHVAANCDVLAIALFIEQYKKDLSADVKDRIESDWIARWRGSLGNPNRKPRRVMKAYLDLMDMTMDDLDDQMCWDCWPDEEIEPVDVPPASA